MTSGVFTEWTTTSKDFTEGTTTPWDFTEGTTIPWDFSQTTTNISTANITTVSSTTKQDNSLIIGLSVGIPCAVLLICAVLLFFYWRWKNTKAVKTRERQTSNPYETRLSISNKPPHEYEGICISSPGNLYEVTLPSTDVYETIN